MRLSQKKKEKDQVFHDNFLIIYGSKINTIKKKERKKEDRVKYSNSGVVTPHSLLQEGLDVKVSTSV